MIPLSGFSNTVFQESAVIAFRRALSGRDVFFQTDQRESLCAHETLMSTNERTARKARMGTA